MNDQFQAEETESPRLHLFEAYGVEIEYMIVDAETLAVKAISDRVLEQAAGEIVSETEQGELSWSNELALHVIELKTNGPAKSLQPLPAAFQQHAQRVNEILAAMGCRLMPTAMHPWMDPYAELQLWPHEYNPVYEAYNRIFDCRGHGWANLQSVHLNLPFGDDVEFARLHAAIRLILPLLPALAASSPVADRKIANSQDYRLEVYRGNSQKIPSVSGRVIPEQVFTYHDYNQEIFQRMYRDIRPYDPDGILQHEFLNSRGAIARFDRNSIEIRLIDAQEYPAADIAICAAVSAVIKALIAERWTSMEEQQSLSTEKLAYMLERTIRDAERAEIPEPDLLRQFGINAKTITAAELWQHLASELKLLEQPETAPLKTILDEGPLSRRILKALGDDLDNRLEPVYRELCDCLAEGRPFQETP